MKRCLKSLIIREMQIKTTLRYQPTTIKMAIIKKNNNNIDQDMDKRESLYTVGGNEIGAPLLKIV